MIPVVRSVSAVDPGEVRMGVTVGWWLVVIHAQSIADVGEIWVAEAMGVQVVVAELGRTRFTPWSSIDVVGSRCGYVRTRACAGSIGDDGKEMVAGFFQSGGLNRLVTGGGVCAAEVGAVGVTVVRKAVERGDLIVLVLLQDGREFWSWGGGRCRRFAMVPS